MSESPEDAARMLEGIGAAIEGALDEAALVEVGHLATAIVLARAKTGIDPDGKPFKPYAPSYATERREAGLGATPDLARTGHMFGTITPILTGEGAVEVGPHLSEFEAMKMAVHDRGVDKQVAVKPRRYEVYTVDRRFTSQAHAMKAGGNAYGGMARAHTRHQKIPQREVLDIRKDDELAVVAEHCGNVVITKLERKLG